MAGLWWVTASRGAVVGSHSIAAGGQAVNKQITAAAMAAATLLAAGCANQHPPASPAPAGAAKASIAAHAASNPACMAQLSAWRPTGERFDRALLRDAGAIETDLRSLISQVAQGAQPSISAALTDSGTLASAAKQMLGDHLPPSCVPHMRAALTAAMLSFEKQATDMNNASLALTDWNAQGAERLLKAASHDITAGTTGIGQATADSGSYQS
jgi:hypothetical protein